MEEHSQGTGVVSRLEKLAMKGEPMPEGLSLVDQMFFQGMAYLYARFHLKVIDRNTGSREKGLLIYEHDKEARSAAFSSDLAAHRSEVIRATETALCRYRKERTLEAADVLADVLDGRVFHHAG